MAIEDTGPCPACECTGARLLFEATDRLLRTTAKTFAVVECTGCLLIRLHPWPTPEELGYYYPEGYWYSAEGGRSARLAEAYRRFALRDHVNFVLHAIDASGEQGPVLDVGCGGGLLLRMLKERGRRGVGLDFSLRAASMAWQTQGVPTLCGDFTVTPFPESTFAAVSMFHVLEHLYDPAAYLAAAHRALKPNGRLVVQVPNASSWQFLLLGEKWRGIDVPRHLFDFRGADVISLVESCDFEVTRVKHFNLRDNPTALSTSLAPWLDPGIRNVRRDPETTWAKVAKDLAYLGLTMASLPFAILEATCGAGATIMVEARKKAS